MDKETYNKTKRYLKSVAEHEERCQILAKEFQESNSDELKEALNKEQKELNQTITNIQNAIAQLPNSNQRTVLTLKYLGEIKNGRRERIEYLWQIANVMGYSETPIKVFHSNAIKNLKISEVIGKK